MINRETVQFISMLNCLSYRVNDEIGNKFVPFSKVREILGDDLIKTANEDGEPLCSLAFLYDDEEVVLTDADGLRYYPLVMDTCVDDNHTDIVDYFPNVYVRVDDEADGETVSRYQLVATVNEDIKKAYSHSGDFIYIDAAGWYMADHLMFS